MESIMSMSRQDMMNAISDYKKEIEKKIQSGESETSFVIGGNEYTNTEWKKILKSVDKELEAIKEEQKERAQKRKNSDDVVTEYNKLRESTKNLFKKLTGEADSSYVPYSEFAQGGTIQYKGVIFECDEINHSINLGDVTTDRSKVITVKLENGGTLNFNVENMDDLREALDMFTPEDIRRILEAISLYEKAQQTELEVDAMVDKLIAEVE